MRRLRFGPTTDGELADEDVEAEIGTDDGDFVVLDSNENVVMRYDETSGTWGLENNDVTGVDALEAESVSVDAATIATALGIPVYADDTNAPTGSQYFDSADEQLEYKDESGTIFTAGGLQDGDDFDGQGTSTFDNLQSLSTDELNNADLANAEADTVPTAQGDGTLAMDIKDSADRTVVAEGLTVSPNSTAEVTTSFGSGRVYNVEFTTDSDNGAQIRWQKNYIQVASPGVGIEVEELGGETAVVDVVYYVF